MGRCSLEDPTTTKRTRATAAAAAVAVVVAAAAARLQVALHPTRFSCFGTLNHFTGDGTHQN